VNFTQKQKKAKRLIVREQGEADHHYHRCSGTINQLENTVSSSVNKKGPMLLLKEEQATEKSASHSAQKREAGRETT
jgi:hypothetical protein